MQLSYTTAPKKSDAISGYKTLGIFLGRMLLIISLTVLAMLFSTGNSTAQQDQTADSPETSTQAKPVAGVKEAASAQLRHYNMPVN